MSSNNSRLLILSAAGIVLAGCTAQTDAPESAVPADKKAPASAPASAASTHSADPASLGTLSEAEFAALHTHKEADTQKLMGTTVDLGRAKGYLSLPKGAKAPLPGVIVLQEWWGLNDNIRHWTDRLAREGYAALAVDLYAGKVTTNPDEAMKFMKGAKPEELKKAIAAGIAMLRTDERVKAPKVASIGWCFGGGWSLQTALMDAELAGAVMYYGFPVMDEKALAKIGGKLMAHFGDKDTFIPTKQVSAFEAALKNAGVSATIHRYDANHAFANPSGAHYDGAHAETAWTRSKAFLAEVLGG